MSTASYELFIFNGKKQQAASSALEILFSTVAVGLLGSGLVISESSGKFDMNGKVVGNIAAASGSGQAIEYAQFNTAQALKLSLTGGTMSGNIAMGGNKVTGSAAGTTSGDLVEYAQFIAGLAATGTSAEWQNSVVTATLVDPTGLTPTAGDRYLINGTGVSGWTGKDNQIATYVSGTVTLVGSWTYQIPTTGTFTDADDNTSALYYFGGSSWSTKSFEATTASGFLDKTGFNITFKNLANGKIVVGDGSGVAQAVTPSGDVTMDNAGAFTIANNAVTTAKILNDAVTTAKILNANVTAAKLATVTDGVTLDQSGAGSTLEIKALGVDTAQIAALAVTTAKIGATAVTAAKLGSDVAGTGLKGGNGAAIAVDYAASVVNDNGGTISAGQIVYLKSNGHVDLAIASTTNLDAAELGIVEDTTIATTATGRVVFKRGDIVGGFSSLTPGAMCYVSRGTAGAVTQSLTGFVSGEYVYEVGRALSATQIVYNPCFEWQYA